MRCLILADIHSNLIALEAVLADAAGSYDTVVCLGDVVGYGSNPNEVTAWVKANAALAIRGNHDRACSGDEAIEWFTAHARTAAFWTRSKLSPENQEYLRSLPAGPAALDGFHLVHGSPADEDEYIANKNEAAHQYASMPGEVCFFGHTHIQSGFAMRNGKAWTMDKPAPNDAARCYELEPDTWYLLNPGSVGQPRDGDPRAGYALYDTVKRVVAFHRVAYDVTTARKRIEAAGLPGFLASRLVLGR